MGEQLNQEEFDNFISVAVALKVTVDGLQDFVQDSLQKVHQELYRKCAILQCNVNCSRRYGTGFTQWCDACKSWKTELHKLNKFKNHWDRINWKEIDTIDIPFSFQEMAKVFVQNFVSVRQGSLLQDMNAIMSLFRNMKTFNGIVNQSIISDTQRFRNQNFGHNYSLQLHDVEKTQSIDCFENLLRVAEIACTKSGKRSLTLLAEVRQNRKIPSELLDQATLNIVIAINDDFQRLYELHQDNNSYETFYKQIQFNVRTLTNYPDQPIEAKQNHFGFSVSVCVCRRFPFGLLCGGLLLITLLVVLFGPGVFFVNESSPKGENFEEGCLSMYFDAYWKSDLDFDYYIEELKNQSTIEREWLQHKIQKNIENENRGVLLLAGMGYGKSSIISNIVCADKNSKWHPQRRQVLAYHMCRYDVKLSTKPGVFIRNLAGRIIQTIPEIGNNILSDNRALEFLYGTRCIEDPLSCLEFSILKPLQSFSTDQTYLIVVDALDECDVKGDNSLVNLFYRKISVFPKYVKFLFTSRYIERLVHKFKELCQLDLESYFLHNIEDIREYIYETIKLSDTDIGKLIEVSGRNFLHVKLYLKHCEQRGFDNCDRSPDSLDKMYALNFERVFGENAELFEEFLQIFEVLCSLQSPIEEHKLLKIAGIRKGRRKRKVLRILGNELGHFVKNSNGRLSFRHKSISDFLTNPSRKHQNFYVNQTDGHKRFANYLLKSLNLTKTDNLVEIVYHVALSGEIEYEQLLLDFSTEFGKERIELNFTYLFEAARQINHFNTIKLLVRLVIPSVNSNISVEEILNISIAAFIATENGNDESLKSFLQHGANIHYKNPPRSNNILLPTSSVAACKYVFLCGYNLLHVAAQRGYTKIVKYLLFEDKTLLYDTNSLNLNAFQLAAEHGHTNVMNIILNYNSAFADLHSLHHASENGNIEAVEILLKYVEDKCFPCNGSLNWRQVIPSDLRDDTFHTIIHSSKQKNAPRNVFDDLWIIMCDTALNAAVRNGHFNIVKALLNKSVETLNCRSFDGSSILMTAVKYNQSDIFKYLYEKKANVSLNCETMHTFDNSKLFASEIKILEMNTCPRKFNVGHLLAIYDHVDIIRYLIDHGHKLWELQDASGITPLHYAFCHGSSNFVNFFMYHSTIRLNFTITSLNGSTPFHSAARCKSSMLQYFFRKMTEVDRVYSVPNVLDNNGSSILHYGMNSPVSSDDLINIDRSGKDEFTYSLFNIVLRSGHDFHHIDDNKRNFLHYAAYSGNYWALSLSIGLERINVKMLLGQKDVNKRTPLEVAFDVLPKRRSFEHVRIPHNCSFNEVFLKSCKANYSVLLSPHEYFIFRVSQYLNSNNLFSGYNITELLILSITKSRIYPILILKTYSHKHFVATMSKSTALPYFISQSDIPFLSELILHVDNSLRCDGSESPLHIILQNDRNIRWEFSSFSFLQPLFKIHTTHYLNHCFDKDGYNLLHRSVMGGNRKLFVYLLNNGFDLWQRSKHNESVLETCILTAPFMTNGSIPSYYTQGLRFHILQYVFQDVDVIYHHEYQTNYDKTLTAVLSEMEKSKVFNRNELKSKLCQSRKKELGLLHIAAAKGFLLFLQKIDDIYGSLELLKCKDWYQITPIYLAHIYNQSNVVRWMNTKTIFVNDPHKDAKKILLYNFLENYTSKTKFDWICFLRYRDKYVILISRMMIKCSSGNQHKSIFFSSTSDKVENLRIFLIRQSHKYIKFSLHNKHYTTAITRKCSLKTHHDYGYLMLWSYMLFGYHDKEFYYHFLLHQQQLAKTNTTLNIRQLEEMFFAVFGGRFDHIGRLKMRPQLHNLWLHDLLPSDVFYYGNFLSFKMLEIKRMSRISNNTNSQLKMCNRLIHYFKKLMSSTENIGCQLCLGNLRGIRDEFASVQTNEDLYNSALAFYFNEHSAGLSPEVLARNFVAQIAPIYHEDKYNHLVIEIEILIKRTLGRIQRLPQQAKHNVYIAHFRKTLLATIQNLEHYYKYNVF